MIQLQIISKIISTGNNTIIEDNLLTEDYFQGYKDEYNFIQNHIKDYGNVPDKATFLSQFPSIELVEVSETDKYLVDTVREEYLYYKSVPIVKKIAELLKSDANAAAEYMISEINNIQPNYSLDGVNIISDAQERFDRFIERKNNEQAWYFTTGFKELDDLIHGVEREEELFVLFARTNQGKSWVLEKICTHIWGLGFNVGYVSPEMSAISVGYRFDTLFKNFSNSGLMFGKQDVNEDSYQGYIDELATNKHKFIVATPLDFDRKITISKLRTFVKQHKLDVLAVDGIKYLTDERYKRGDSMTTSLTNISEDLMSLSMELKIPVLIVVQSNRGGVIDKDTDGTPDLENIRDSDGIAQNASKVLSIRQKDNVLKLGVKKQRFGPINGELNYAWDINIGEFTFIPSNDDAEPQEQTERKLTVIKGGYKDKRDVF